MVSGYFAGNKSRGETEFDHANNVPGLLALARKKSTGSGN
jgi:hypothetical protein